MVGFDYALRALGGPPPGSARRRGTHPLLSSRQRQPRRPTTAGWAPIDCGSSHVVTIDSKGCMGPVVRKSVSRYLAAGVVSAIVFTNLLPPVAAATASTEPDVSAGDMCGHVQNRAVRALIGSPEDGTFSIEATQDEPGKLTCVWSSRRTRYRRILCVRSDCTPPWRHYCPRGKRP